MEFEADFVVAGRLGRRFAAASRRRRRFNSAGPEPTCLGWDSVRVFCRIPLVPARNRRVASRSRRGGGAGGAVLADGDVDAPSAAHDGGLGADSRLRVLPGGGGVEMAPAEPLPRRHPPPDGSQRPVLPAASQDLRRGTPLHSHGDEFDFIGVSRFV